MLLSNLSCWVLSFSCSVSPLKCSLWEYLFSSFCFKHKINISACLHFSVSMKRFVKASFCWWVYRMKSSEAVSSATPSQHSPHNAGSWHLERLQPPRAIEPPYILVCWQVAWNWVRIFSGSQMLQTTIFLFLSTASYIHSISFMIVVANIE